MKGTRATYSIAASRSDNTACAAPPAQKHCRETPFAARIRKAGRIPTAPLARRHPRKSSACRRPRPAERKPTKDNSNGFESSEVNRRYRD